MTEEILPFHEHFYVLSTSTRIDDRTRVLKQGDTFAVFDRFGDIDPFGPAGLGIYHKDTRFLSRLALKVQGGRPLLLSSTIRDDNVVLAVDSMNSDIQHGDEVTILRGTVHVFRSKFLWEASCFERIRIHNYGSAAVTLDITIALATDFADIFEVRGAARAQRGRVLSPQVGSDSLVFTYQGLDDKVRRTRVVFDPTPAQVGEAEVRFDARLDPGEEREFFFTISCEIEEAGAAGVPTPLRHDAASRAATDAFLLLRSGSAEIFTSNEQFNDWLNRSLADLRMMRTDTADGPYPYAGVPWFCTVFGRDGIITALECLSFIPALARGVLAHLAATQAETQSAEQDAEPGKILHEARDGEMAALGEVPFRRYYGSIDATPLFVVLAGAYYERTGDREFAAWIWPHVERALAWIDRHGDLDGDGFVEYLRRSREGLIHQGWKDSQNAVFHADGTAAEGPIALCEVQGYVYAARLAASGLAAALGHGGRAKALTRAAGELRRRFEAAYWCEDLATYALALDGRKQPTRVRTSNAGHCLFSGIASDEHAALVAATLTSRSMFSGWGVRTVAAGEAGYNPMSYHNGSVWPHDNALIAAGFARYGLMGHAASILTGLLDASIFFELHRLPELFCGFPRRPGESPTLYPVACSPQAWAAGAVYSLLESCLGLKVQGAQRRVVFANPSLPASLEEVSIRNLRVADAQIDLLATRHQAGDVSINVLRREGVVDAVILK